MNDSKPDRGDCIKTDGQCAGMIALFHAGWQAVYGNRNLKIE